MNVPKLRFKEFNDEWTKEYAGNLCSIQTGKSNTQDKVDDGIYPFYVRSKIVEKSHKYIFDTEAVLTVGDGVGVGKVFHYINGKFDCHQRVYMMNNFKNITAKYFYYIFSRDFDKRVMKMTAKTSVDSVRYEMIDKMEIYYPTIKEQDKVARTLELLDKKIELQTKKIEDLKLFKKGLNKNIFSNFNAKYKVDELIKEYNKKTSKNNQFEVLSSTANGIILQNEYFNKQAASLDNTGYKIVPFGFITYRSMSDTGEFHFNIQNITENGIVSPAYPVFEINEDIVDKTYFIYYINENKSFKNKILSLKEGGTRYALSMSKFKEINLDLPPLEYQKKYSKLLNTYNRKIKNE